MVNYRKKRLGPGVAFGDSIRTEQMRSGKRTSFPRDEFSFRGFLLPIAILFVSGILLLKLIDLQVVHGNYYRDISDNNRIKHETIHAERGIIFDRNNSPLVFNIPGFRETKNGKTVLIPHNKALSLIATNKKLEIDSLREYPLKQDASHVIGYVGQISEDELKTNEYLSYIAGEIVGKIGIEKQYESLLKGIDGRRLIEIDSSGKIIRTLGETRPVPGKNVIVTLDSSLQKATSQAMKDVKKGAVVVSTPTGEILAMVSSPTFDPNLFTLDENYQVASNAAYRSVADVLLDGQRQPLLDRPISGVYPPGSTFKLVTAAVGLEEKKFDERFTVEDTGVLKVGEFSFANWYFTQYGGRDGSVDVIKGIARSNDIFFYKAAEKIGVDTLSENAKKFGIGTRLNIDLPGEHTGLLPTTDWKEKVVGDTWYLGDTYHYGIGQGYLLSTPLQVNAWTQVVANGGTLYKPHLLKNQKDEIIHPKFLSEKTLSLIRQGMIDSCKPGGVAWPLFDFAVKNSKLKIDGRNILETQSATGSATSSAQLKEYRTIPIACKTGTAQHGGEQTLPHAWITLFAPAYDPEIVVTVLVEESGEGSTVAGPIAKEILESWFSDNK